jgi:hypothetical protein
MDLYASIAMDVKNQELFMKLICKYCNGCKKPTTIYETYMQVLHIQNGLMKNYNRKDVSIVYCSFGYL